jgi:hypothetical protein
MEESLVVEGERQAWLTRTAKALIAAGYKDVRTDTTLGQVVGTYKKFPTSGEIVVTATPSERDGMVKLLLKTTANVDNIYALFSSPNKKMMNLAKQQLR